jgi:hypothetical protein
MRCSPRVRLDVEQVASPLVTLAAAQPARTSRFPRNSITPVGWLKLPKTRSVKVTLSPEAER